MRRPNAHVATTQAAVLTACLLLAGCGVATQDQAQPLPSGAFPVVGSEQSTVEPVSQTDLYFVSGPGLEAVSESIRLRTARGVLTALGAGPPPERRNDLRTLINEPLNGTPLLSVTSVEGDRVVLARTDDFPLLPASDQVLLIGQVVLSLDGIGRTSVMVTDMEGMAVPLALPDGRVLEGPARAEDFEALLAAGGAASESSSPEKSSQRPDSER